MGLGARRFLAFMVQIMFWASSGSVGNRWKGVESMVVSLFNDVIEVVVISPWLCELVKASYAEV